MHSYWWLCWISLVMLLSVLCEFCLRPALPHSFFAIVQWFVGGGGLGGIGFLLYNSTVAPFSSQFICLPLVLSPGLFSPSLLCLLGVLKQLSVFGQSRMVWLTWLTFNASLLPLSAAQTSIITAEQWSLILTIPPLPESEVCTASPPHSHKWLIYCYFSSSFFSTSPPVFLDEGSSPVVFLRAPYFPDPILSFLLATALTALLSSYQQCSFSSCCAGTYHDLPHSQSCPSGEHHHLSCWPDNVILAVFLLYSILKLPKIIHRARCSDPVKFLLQFLHWFLIPLHFQVRAFQGCLSSNLPPFLIISLSALARVCHLKLLYVVRTLSVLPWFLRHAIPFLKELMAPPLSSNP